MSSPDMADDTDVAEDDEALLRCAAGGDELLALADGPTLA